MRVRHTTLTAQPNDPTKDISANAWNEDHYIEPPTPAEIGAEAVGVAASLVSAHEAASDPHPQYLTSTEGDAAYAPIGHVGSGATAHAAATTSVAGFMSAADKTKLDGVASGATANSSDATLLARANHTGTQLASTISDFAEAVDDRVSSLLVAGANITLTYNDAGNTLTIAASGTGGGVDLGVSIATRRLTHIF